MSQPTHDLLRSAAVRLGDAGIVSARHDAEALLAHAWGVQRGQLLRHEHVTDAVAACFTLLVDRRVRREPLQHITGTASFRHLDLVVGPGVFVPRPETEVMTGVAVAELSALREAGVSGLKAVDLCTGSGAVAAALASEVAGVDVTAIEASVDAHAYALLNLAGLGVDTRLGDIADLGDTMDHLTGTVHVVTANPPYIPLSEFESVESEARDFDPPEALWSGVDGLEVIKLVARAAARLLVDGGLVVCEHADVQGQSAPAVFSALPEWAQVRDNRDLAGRPRFVSARRVSRSAGPAGTMAS